MHHAQALLSGQRPDLEELRQDLEDVRAFPTIMQAFHLPRKDQLEAAWRQAVPQDEHELAYLRDVLVLLE